MAQNELEKGVPLIVKVVCLGMAIIIAKHFGLF